jgi:hypothetical protein
MKRALVVAGIFLAGCAADGRHLRPGVSDAAAVRAQMGTPALGVLLPGGGDAWFYPRGRVARQTYRAELGADGRVRSVEQVLDDAHFNRIVAGKSTRDDVRRLIGPADQEYRGNAETVLQYHYFWVPDSPWAVHVGIGDDGIVTGLARLSELDAGSRGN